MLRRPMSSALPHELRLALSSTLQRPPRLSTLLAPQRQATTAGAISYQRSASRLQPTRLQPSVRAFHVSPRREIPAPLALLALLKSSTILASVTTLSRVLISFLPFPLLLHIVSEKKLRHYRPEYRSRVQSRIQASDEAWRIHDAGEQPPKDAPASLLLELERINKWQSWREPLEKKRMRTAVIVWIIIGLPVLAFAAAVAAGLERTPVTGRWRLILLSPTEEEVLHDALSGTGWFDHILRLLKPTAESPPPAILPPQDWRWAWVESTLRALERGAQECYVRDIHAHHKPADSVPPASRDEALDLPFPPPPPPPYPLRPRPRVSQILHHSLPPPSTATVAHSSPPEPEHALLGPPFSLLLLDSPEANALSFGFGGDGAAGIVVNTGILDEILRPSAKPSSSSPAAPATASPPTERSWLSYLVPGLGWSRPSAPSRRFTPPTEEQTLHLAAVLAHEVAHLLLTHHLESLSQRQILLPSVFNLGVDIVRTILFPFTWILGPFVNDGIAALSKTGESELSALGSNCSNQALEVEADLVGLRIMAHARFNPFDAAQFWLPTHSPTPSMDHPSSTWGSAWRTLSSGFGLSHPSNEVRSEAVRQELAAWEKAWRERQQAQADDAP